MIAIELDVNAKIIHGKAEVVLGHEALGDFDLVVADPPYSGGGKRPEWRTTGAVPAALTRPRALVNTLPTRDAVPDEV